MNAPFKLNYRGDLRGMIDTVMGPNLFGEYLVVTEEEWDALQDKTTVGLDIYRPDMENNG